MKILTEKFCSLSTSPVWQAWLFHFNAGIYKQFIKRLMESRGCNQNKELMIELLAEIDQIPDGSDKLLTFLKLQYPYIIADHKEPSAKPPEKGMLQKTQTKKLFADYVPGMMTYPRRMIFQGPNNTLNAIVKAFIADKIEHEHVVIGDSVYIEYLTKADEHVKNRIPSQNWQIRVWRAQT